MRWPDGVTCPHCGGKEHSFTKPRRLWRCKACKKQFSIRVKTIMEDSPLGLDKWLVAMWLMVNAKNGISSYEVARALGVCQKTAWFLLHRIRHLFSTGSFEKKLAGFVEADECYIGGKAENMHASKREEKIKGRGGVGKAIVVGVMSRGGEVRVKVVGDTTAATIGGFVTENVRKGSHLHTDTMSSYSGLSSSYMHETVNHSAHEYVRENVHCNSMENFWSLLKRMIVGTYISVDVAHLGRYLVEETTRFNLRKVTDADRFEAAVKAISGKRLSWAALTAR
jgi:transposase-like protein